ncbi:hypothetical protein ACTNEW_08570 [Blautia sp. HCP3S3_G3]|uniref:hypothetical protein n=1 Tax=Blautia sp. HCP3S3_G3 TaxID=3438913 RepID=UPI003F8A63B1
MKKCCECNEKEITEISNNRKTIKEKIIKEKAITEKTVKEKEIKEKQHNIFRKKAVKQGNCCV